MSARIRISFDTVHVLQHSNHVRTLIRRAVALLAVLALAPVSPALCAGWAPTPEARMACCADGLCPMHQSEPAEPADAAHHGLTQAQADSCCAASEPDDPAPSQSPVPVATPLAVVSTPATPVVLQPVAAGDAWRTLVPVPIAHVPRHVLLSVFLV